MKAIVSWRDAMSFEGTTDGHKVLMDAKSPIGKNSGPTPKELLAFGMGGCTAMDVIALLKKYKQMPSSFDIEVEIEPTEGQQPAVFARATLLYVVKGQIDSVKLVEAVELSQTKYCGVNAMLSKSFPIYYRIELNGVEVGSGKAEF